MRPRYLIRLAVGITAALILEVTPAVVGMLRVDLRRWLYR